MALQFPSVLIMNCSAAKDRTFANFFFPNHCERKIIDEYIDRSVLTCIIPTLTCRFESRSVLNVFTRACFVVCIALYSRKTSQRTFFVLLARSRTNKPHTVGRLEILSWKPVTVQSNRKTQDQTQGRWINTAVQGNIIGLLNRGFRLMASWRLKEMFNVSTLRFNADKEGDRFLGTFLSSTSSDWGCLAWFPTQRHSGMCYKMRICRLAVSYDGVPSRFLLAFLEFSNNLLPQQWTVRGWPAAWPARSADLNPLDFLVTSELYSLCCSSRRGAALAATNRALEICSKWGSHSTDVLHPASRLKVDAVSIFLISGGRNSKTKFQKAYVHKFFSCILK